MSRYVFIAGVTLLGIALIAQESLAIQRRGGGGGGRSAMGGSRMSGGGGGRSMSSRSSMSRPSSSSRSAFSPSSRPSTSRPSTSRPSYTRPSSGISGGASRPSTSRPSTSLPSFGGSRPSTGVSRPSTGISRPSTGTTRPSTGINRPSTGINRPSTGINRPSTGLTRPGGSSPSIGNRPSTSLPSNRPSTLPSNRPSTLPSNRPSTLPSTRPGIGDGNRPGIGNGNRPGIGDGNRPGIGNGNRPGIGDRPSQGDLNDFLGIHQPGGIGNRPGTGDRIGNNNRIGNNRIGNNVVNRPVNIGNQRNNYINNRPSWVNINNNSLIGINNRWQGAVFNRPGNAMYGWQSRHPQRMARYGYWGSGVRSSWRRHGHYHNWFGGSWWSGHHHGYCGWHYGYRFGYRPWSYWWTVPAFASFNTWFTWSAPANVWAEPIYYDYGSGGNVTYENNIVYIDGEEVATADEFAQSAAALATVEPPASEEEAEEVEWMPLGTFAVASDESETDPTRAMQLAVSKEGIISGTMYNNATDEAYTIQGQVDKDTQRVAFRIGSNEEIVVETGLYDLTQQECPILVHYGTERVEYFLLVRLDYEGTDDESTLSE